MPLVYDELRALAGSYFRKLPADHTLQPTALVNEAYIRLARRDDFRCESRTHFFNIAAHAMRQILVDHARARGAVKRGASQQRVTLSEGAEPSARADVVLTDLADALEALSRLNSRHADVVVLRFLGGLTVAEVAEELGVSKRTVEDDWRLARAWLIHTLGDAACDRS